MKKIDGYNARPDLTLSMMRQNIKCYIYNYAKYVFQTINLLIEI